MKIEQLNVFIENRTGRLAGIAEVLGDIGVNIRAISLADTANFGILRLIVDDIEKAKQRLKERGFTVRLTEVIAVKLKDRPGELGRLLKIIEAANLNTEYIYGLSEGSKEYAVLILKCSELDRAIEILMAHSVELLDYQQVIHSQIDP
ncbi:MAG: amino acid-binding protein [Thermodesulfobacteriota bacterium]